MPPFSSETKAPAIQPLRASRQRRVVEVIDQTRLPQESAFVPLATAADATRAIATMQVRGAPLIGVTAAYGLALALGGDPSDAGLRDAFAMLLAARPTAVNLHWALERVRAAVAPLSPSRAPMPRGMKPMRSRPRTSRPIAPSASTACASSKRLPRSARRSTCSRTATPVHWRRWAGARQRRRSISRRLAGIPVHVWVSETRPRLQGAKLTAWELRQNGVPHTLIVDAAGAALMRQRRVDLVLVGADRVAANGDVCNKIGTYEKALAAQDNQVPMYAAVPSSTIDWTLADGDAIPIEERSADEVAGSGADAIAPPGTAVLNPAFDVTPGRLLTGIVTERGTCSATAAGLGSLFARGSMR